MASSHSDRAVLADRYAKALFELALSEKLQDKVEADLMNMREALEISGDLRAFIKHPLIPRDEQLEATEAVLQHLNAQPLTRHFFGVLSNNRRLAIARHIIHSYLELASRQRGELRARVVTAKALEPAQLDGIRDAIAKAMGAPVVTEPQVSSDILGGLVVQVGSKVLDASVRTRLEKLEQSLKQSARAVTV